MKLCFVGISNLSFWTAKKSGKLLTQSGELLFFANSVFWKWIIFLVKYRLLLNEQMPELEPEKIWPDDPRVYFHPCPDLYVFDWAQKPKRILGGTLATSESQKLITIFHRKTVKQKNWHGRSVIFLKKTDAPPWRWYFENKSDTSRKVTKHRFIITKMFTQKMNFKNNKNAKSIKNLANQMLVRHVLFNWVWSAAKFPDESSILQLSILIIQFQFWMWRSS